MTVEPIYYAPNIEANKKKLQDVRDRSVLVLGLGAGILTLESLYGFAFYFAGITFANAVFYLICCGKGPKQYFANPLLEIFVSGVVADIPGFVMMWCLLFALVKSNS